ncbi:MAG TPA: Fur family transcriptional regulator [Rhodoblastus sp.]|nr:Fur family transcriptional regulator [Rhodoblastus sp.]
MEKRESAPRSRRRTGDGSASKGAVYATTPAVADLSGCPLHDLRRKLSEVGLRPTRQRLRLGWLLFGGGDRHVTAERLYEEALAARAPISLATVYNTLNQFTSAGLLKEVTVDGAKTYFDTNLAEHQHFVTEDDTQVLTDLSKELIDFSRLPEPPEGMEIARVDVVIRLRRKAS